MLHVIDASVAVKWFLPEPHSDKATKLLTDFRNSKLDLTAPDLLISEVANALFKRTTKLKHISAPEAAGIYTDLMEVQLNLHPTPSLVEAALGLSIKHEHPVYDMVYLVLALDLGCDLITADEPFVNKLASQFP